MAIKSWNDLTVDQKRMADVVSGIVMTQGCPLVQKVTAFAHVPNNPALSEAANKALVLGEAGMQHFVDFIGQSIMQIQATARDAQDTETLEVLEVAYIASNQMREEAIADGRIVKQGGDTDGHVTH